MGRESKAGQGREGQGGFREVIFDKSAIQHPQTRVNYQRPFILKKLREYFRPKIVANFAS
jgi:hypothetical protein